MKYFIFLFTVILLFDACSSSKNWRGTSNLRGTQAEFEKLNGRQAFTILVPTNNTYLKYHFAINSGKLETTIKSPTEMLMSKELGKVESDSIHIVNQKGVEYKIYLKGKQASGEFDIQFITSLE